MGSGTGGIQILLEYKLEQVTQLPCILVPLAVNGELLPSHHKLSKLNVC